MHSGLATNARPTTPATLLSRFPPAPLLPAAVGLVAGIAWDAAVGPQLLLNAALVSLAVILLAIRDVRSRRAWVATALASCGLGGVLHDNAYRRLPPDHLVRRVPAQPTIVRVHGTVVSPPRTTQGSRHFFSPWMYAATSTRFVLSAESLDTNTGPITVTGLIAVHVPQIVGHVRLGDAVSVHGTASRLRPPANPGQFDYARWWRRQGIPLTLRCKNADLVAVDARGAHAGRAWLDRVRLYARAFLVNRDDAPDPENAGLLETLVLGERHAVPRAIEDRFLRTGTTHFLAVSGSHLAVIGGFVWYLGRRLGATRRRCAAFALAATLGYALLVDPEPPVLRAAVLGAVYCLAALVRRPAQPLNATAFAALLLLTLRPTMLFEAGFQLSFLTVLGILLLWQPLQGHWRRWIERIPPDAPSPITSRSTTLAWLLTHPTRLTIRDSAIVSVAASLVAAPVAAVHFGTVAPLAFLCSFLLAPFVSITLLLGAFTLVVGVAVPIALPPFQTLTRTSADVVLVVVESLARWSPQCHGLTAVAVGGIQLTLAAAAWVVWAVAPTNRVGDTPDPADAEDSFTPINVRPVEQTDRRRPPERRRHYRNFAVAAVFRAVLLIGLRERRSPDSRPLRATLLSVGRGTAIVLEWPDGSNWLYDCGTNGAYDVGASTIVPFCRHRGITRLDRIVISHPNTDHFSGLFSVLDQLSAGPVLLNHHFASFAAPGGAAEALVAELTRRRHPIEFVGQGDAFTLSNGAKVECLWPPQTLPDRATSNDSSTVLRLTYRDRRILLCGDIERAAMNGLLNLPDLPSDVLILPHHGAVEKNTPAFVSAVDPAVCLASTHAGGPSKEQQRAFGNRHFFSTADQGALTLTMDDDGVRIDGHNGGQPRTLLPIPDAGNPDALTINPVHGVRTPGT